MFLTPLERRQLLSSASFAPSQPIPNSQQAASLVVADVNGDGRPDLISGYAVQSQPGYVDTGRIGIRLGNGDGTFAAPFTIAMDNPPRQIVVGDANGDGRADLVIADFNKIEVLRGNGDGTFGGAILFSTPGFEVNSLQLVDINGDGRPDIVGLANELLYGQSDTAIDIGVFSEEIVVLPGNGDGTFGAPVSLGVSGSPALGVADINSDGKLDLVVSNGGALNFYFGNGNGTFSSPATMALAGSDLLGGVLDMNGDGRADLVILGHGSSQDVGVMLGNGNGTFQSPVTTAVTNNIRDPIIADINGDGIPDLVGQSNPIFYAFTANVSIVLPQGPTLTVLLGKGNGAFDVGSTPSVSINAQLQAVVDVNGDERPDLITTGSDPLDVSVNTTPGSVPFAQIVGGQLVITGTSGDDSIGVTESNGILTATLNGQTSAPFKLADVQSVEVVALDGEDRIQIGAGVPAAMVLAGGGNDTIVALNGANDTLNGGAGSDSISAAGASGNNVLHGNTGADTLVGGSGADSLLGDRGLDSLVAGANGSLLAGGLGRDTLMTHGGEDTIVSSPGNDSLEV